jgi:peptide chain release factor subunit 1
LYNPITVILFNLVPIEETVAYTNEEHATSHAMCIDKTGLQMEQTEEPQLLSEWLAEKYHTFGAALELVTNRSQEGAQFCKGFGGIGGLLRYKVDFAVFSIADGDEEFYSDSDGI